jgi:hypothetical protein
VTELKDIKFYNVFEDEDFWKHLSVDVVLRGEIEELKNKHAEDSNDTEAIKKLKEKKDRLYNLRKNILEKFNVYISGYGQKAKLDFATIPVSCFSMPFWDSLSFNDLGFQIDNIYFRELGPKALNQKTKNHFIQDNKFLFLKIDLTHDKSEINMAVDDLVDAGQKLIGKRKKRARSEELQKLFNQIFEKLVRSFSVEMAISKTQVRLKATYGIEIDPDSLLRKYYRKWKESEGITNIRIWRKEQKRDE